MKTLQECRDAIDILDDDILKLLNKRMHIVFEVGKIKRNSNVPIYNLERETDIIKRLNQISSKSNGLLDERAIQALYLEIFAISRNLECSQKIAFLGPKGSFTHQAAKRHFGATSKYISMSSIDTLFKNVQSKRVKYGVVPIENSRDGIIGETLDLLAKTDVKIVAELTIPIHMTFSTKAKDLTKLTKIFSKDKGFGQCREFLVEYGFNDLQHICVQSTAKAAMLAAKDENSAAICSHVAAKLYNIQTIYDNIEDSYDNKTRFLILSDFKNSIVKNSKTSILVRLKNGDKSGILVNFLQDFNKLDINLTKIESRPSKDEIGFKYWFFLDFIGHIDEEKIQKIFTLHKDKIKWLGSYVEAKYEI